MAGNEEIRKRLLGKFRGTTHERVARSNAAFGALEQRGDYRSTADLLMREIHTLKGESHIMGFLDVNEIAHLTEDILLWARSRKFQLETNVIDLVYLGLDLIQAHVAEDRDESTLTARRAAFLEAGHALLEDVSSPSSPKIEIPDDPMRSGDSEPDLTPKLPQAEAATQTVGRGLGDTIRVPGEMMSRVTNLTGDLLLRQETLTRELNDLWSALRRPVAANNGDWSTSREMLHKLRRLREQAFESSLLLEDLQSTVHRARLLEIAALFDRYPAAIRDMAREHGKRVRVVIRGGDVAGDKQVLDVIDEAILHLVRNSLDHGIESPDERKKAGKPERGTITLAARQKGTRIHLVVKDNGRGMDAQQLRQVAVDRGIIGEDEAQQLDDNAAMQLVFRPRFSTRDRVSKMSGRGVGLDVVSEQVRELGGTIELATSTGRGTSFTLNLPASIVLTRIFSFRCGDVIFGLPSANVDRVFRAGTGELELAGTGYAIHHEDQRIPIADMRRELGSRDNQSNEYVEIVVVQLGTQRIGLAVDLFYGEKQIVQRSLGSFLSGLRLISGAVVLDTGEVALVLSVPEIVHRWGEGDTRLVHALPAHVAEDTPWRVLIVDDSELTRDMLVGVAQRANFTVDEAVNGREGLARMHANRPDLILTDLDMPVMNGFDFIEAVRRDPTFEGVPVVVLTTRGSDQDKRRAMIAGANAYIVKSDFNQHTLQETLDRFLDPRTA